MLLDMSASGNERLQQLMREVDKAARQTSEDRLPSDNRGPPTLAKVCAPHPSSLHTLAHELVGLGPALTSPPCRAALDACKKRLRGTARGAYRGAPTAGILDRSSQRSTALGDRTTNLPYTNPRRPTCSGLWRQAPLAHRLAGQPAEEGASAAGRANRDHRAATGRP